MTACCALIGYPVAYTIANSRPRLRRLLIFVVLIPFWSSILVRSFAWIVILQRTGIVNRALMGIGLIEQPLRLVYDRTGVLIGMTQVLLPFMIFPLLSVMLRIDRRLTSAAATLGAAPWRGFLRVYLPLSAPGFATGVTLVFIISLGYYITPVLLGGPGDIMLAQLIQQQVGDFGNWGLAGALSVMLLATTGLCLGAAYRLAGIRAVPTR